MSNFFCLSCVFFKKLTTLLPPGQNLLKNLSCPSQKRKIHNGGKLAFLGVDLNKIGPVSLGLVGKTGRRPDLPGGPDNQEGIDITGLPRPSDMVGIEGP